MFLLPRDLDPIADLDRLRITKQLQLTLSITRRDEEFRLVHDCTKVFAQLRNLLTNVRLVWEGDCITTANAAVRVE